MSRMDAAVQRHHDHMAKLSRLGEHWHDKLWNGSGPWDGDRYLNLYHHVLTDKIEVRYEVPNEKPQLVFSIALEDFDIDKLCAALAKADNRKKSALEKIDEIDAHNAKVEQENAKAAQERKDAAVERLQWAVARDL